MLYAGVSSISDAMIGAGGDASPQVPSRSTDPAYIWDHPHEPFPKRTADVAERMDGTHHHVRYMHMHTIKRWCALHDM
jgi:hypothetical protein